MEALTNVKVTDASTFLVFHLPEGTFKLHTSSTNRPQGLAVLADLTPRFETVRTTVRGKRVKEQVMTGYVLTRLTYQMGDAAPYTFLDKNLIERRPA